MEPFLIYCSKSISSTESFQPFIHGFVYFLLVAVKLFLRNNWHKIHGQLLQQHSPMPRIATLLEWSIVRIVEATNFLKFRSDKRCVINVLGHYSSSFLRIFLKWSSSSIWLNSSNQILNDVSLQHLASNNFISQSV